MSAKVDTTSAVEPHSSKMSGMSTLSAPPTSSQKVSMFAAKSGFVIPRNKLSGSLIPIIRGGKKLGGGDASNEESTNLTQRKTKWGPDLTQDAAVKRGRALAYQTRVDQIMQQLKLGSLEVGDTEGSPIAAEHPDHRSPSPHNNDKSELLELEKREVIGEILKLNPSYKAPPDYKPLLKESSVPLPVKEHPGFNFIGLIFGPGGDNQKRLEKETGAKIQVYGTKAETGEKGEIKLSDGNEIHGAYEELCVQISAETFEKVDAAVSIIELLVTSVSGNLTAVSTISTSISGDNIDISRSQDAATSNVGTAALDQGVLQPVAGSTQTPLQGQFQFPSPWFPSGQSSGLIPPTNPSSPIFRNHVHLSSSPLNPSNMPSLFGPRPTPAAGPSSILQNQPVFPRPQPQTQVPWHPYMAQISPLGHIGPLRSPLQQPNVSAPLPFTGSQTLPTRPAPITGPLMASLSQPMSGSSSVWSGAPGGGSVSTSLGLSNMGQMAPQMVQPNRPHPQNPQPGVASMAPSNISTASLVSTITFSSRPSMPQISGAAVNHPIAAPHFLSNPPSQVRHPAAFSASVHHTPAPVPAPNSSVNPGLGALIPSPGSSTQPPLPMQSGITNSVAPSTPNFTVIKPPTVTAPSSGNFTFQPHGPQNPVSQTVATLSSQLATQSTSQVQPPAPQVSSFQLAAPKLIPQPVSQVFQRPSFSNLVGQPQAPVSPVPYARTPMGPPRHPSIPNASVSPRTPLPQMGLRNFSPAPQRPGFSGPIVPRPANPVQLQQNYPARMSRPDILFSPNQQFSNTLSFASSKAVSNPGGQQIYDPFSPTSVSTSKAEG
ncbi:atrophin-1 isoform X2 [Juglans microcarpa x Juglans regia]|uniref:atrophin-1 isoform X2 n=1 Tax=Juglans microcarpa x Juglans regia TaxID=2249226 RepID=UPI001B7E8628|nr:atrophin-1 isoform X2 [Juglans microcarpa x Juglans regia]